MIYLDHNATTPPLPEVVEAMLPWLRVDWGNPSSIYGAGRQARRGIDEARAKVAALVNARPEQVIFTSGATEANNAALHSAVFQDPRKRHLVTSCVEHSAVLNYCDYLEKIHGAEVTRLSVDKNGILYPGDLENAIRDDTAVVSLMWANNETGVVWPLEDLSEICRPSRVPLHTDAVQVVGKIPVSFAESGASYLSLSGHKFGAPKGIGALIVAEPDRFLPSIYGGKQERSHRGGTENVAQIIGLGKAAEVAAGLGFDDWKTISAQRDSIEEKVVGRIEGSEINGCRSPRLPNTTNIYLPRCDGDALVTFLDSQGICVSSGSACLESAITPSHVLLSMSGSHDRASESIRISLGREPSTEGDVERLLIALEKYWEINT